LTVGAYGVAFGAAAVANGFTVLQSCLLSLLTFSGASQFAVVGVLGAGGTALSGIATASLLGIRNGLYGVIMAPRLKVKGFKRIIAAQITINWSSARSRSAQPRSYAPRLLVNWFWGIYLLESLHLSWRTWRTGNGRYSRLGFRFGSSGGISWFSLAAA
jgi:predicted branched-subunit amino acid permease